MIANLPNIRIHLASHLHIPQEFNRFGWHKLAYQCAIFHELNPGREKTMFLRGSSWNDITKQWIYSTIVAPDPDILRYLDRYGKWVVIKTFPHPVGEGVRFRNP